MNQSADYSGFNAYTDDPLLGLLTLTLKQSVRDGLSQLGAWAGSPEALNLGVMANVHEPKLQTHDARGNRLDQVDFHPSWHALMRRGVEHGLHNSIWNNDNEEAGGRNVARAARVYMTAGVEMGHLCPLIMTNASVATLGKSQGVLREWLPKILSGKYDPSNKPVDRKQGVTIGMGMTERQGGSDVRANTTVAEELGNGVWKLNGEKWFMSAPMCDAFLVLAQMPGGLGCFMLPRILDDGKGNGLEFRRLKNKLGNKSNASSEVEFRNSLGILIGKPGKGIQAIIDMVSFTRLDCAVASAGLMRTSLAEAIHHCRYRSAFGKKLIDQPLMERVLADMVLDVSAATALVFRLASAFDRSTANPAEAMYARLMTPVIKYWVCKLAPSLVYEAMECLGGNGYIEDFAVARHYREAPLDAIWEGAGNIMCLDVLRVLSKKPEALDTVLDGLQRDLGGESAAKMIDVLRSASKMALDDPGGSRILVEQLAYTAAAAELKRLGAGENADAFIETRLGGLWRSTYGMMDNRYNARRIIEKDFPAFAEQD